MSRLDQDLYDESAGINTSTNSMDLPRIEKLDELVEDNPQFNSYTLFVRDSMTRELHLASMNGIDYRESLDGFFLPADEEKRQIGSSIGQSLKIQQDFFSNPELAHLVAPETWQSDHQETLNQLYKKDGKKVFAPFPILEKIKSCIRYQDFDAAPNMVLFANFNIDEAEIRRSGFHELIYEVFEGLLDESKQWSTQSQQDFEKAYSQTFRILRPIQQLALIGCETLPRELEDCDRLKEFFNSLLKATLEALEIDDKTGFGTIHLFDSTNEELNLVACTCDKTMIEPLLSAKEGKGVVSWVALKRKALVINDLQKSIFNEIRDIHDDYKDATRQLVVPMFAGECLVGIINIETFRKNHFTRQDLYSVYFAAKQAAVAYKFARHVQKARLATKQEKESKKRIEYILDIAESATAHETSRTSILDKLAELLRDWDEFDRAEIWLRSSSNQPFYIAGSSSSESRREIKTRGGGWTDFVYEKQKVVWIDKINSSAETFTSRIWNTSTKEWLSPNNSDKAPDDLNQIVHEQCSFTEVGIPIISQSECLAVVWLKKLSQQAVDCTDLASLFEKLANQTALVLNVIHANDLKREDATLNAEMCTIAEETFPKELGSPGMEGFLLYEPFEGKIGGDLCLATSSQSSEWGYLLGDVAGHGYRAALKMIPLMTAFQIHQKESSSPKYILEQLSEHFSTHEVEYGTAICFSCFHQTEADGNVSKRFLSAAAAGHTPLIIVSGNTFNEFPNPKGVATTLPLGGYVGQPFGEETIEIKAGDLIVGYTDGIDEAFPLNDSSNKFETNGVLATILEMRHKTPEEIARKIFSNSVLHAGGYVRDDATVLVLRVLDIPPQNKDENE